MPDDVTVAMTMAISVGALLGCARRDVVVSMTKEELGAALFNDQRLSEPAGQACADCHDPKLAFTDPEGDRVSAGVIRERFGLRNAPTLLYASFIPARHRVPGTARTAGGQFWDGRADSLEQQVLGPLLNPLEMNNPSKDAIAAKLRKYYAGAFKSVFGRDALVDTDRAVEHLGDALAAFERTPAFAPFSSRYDRYLAGSAQLDASELRGLAIFTDPQRGNCASCHPPPLFTNFEYANIGLPRFADNPFYALPAELNPDGDAHVDIGLAQTTGDVADTGAFRIPTLRNVEKTSPYGHNGYVRRLDEMVELLTGSCMSATGCTLPPPEVPAGAQRVRSSETPLTRQDVVDVTGFLRTLSDE